MDVDQTGGSVNVSPGGDDTKLIGNANSMEPLEKTAGSGFDSRGRRKSKYLSSPYTDIKRRNKDLPAEAEDLRTPCHSHKAKASSVATNKSKSGSKSKLGSKRFRRNWCKKFVSCNTMSCSPEFMNSSSDELLSGLQSMAVDCTLPIQNKSFELVEWFFCRYRVSKYHDEAELATSLLNDKEGKGGKPEGNDSLDIKSEKKRKNNKMENAVRPKMKSLSGLSDMNVNISTGDSQTPGRRLKKKRKVEEVTSMYQQNLEINLNESSSKCSTVPETAQNLSCLTTKGKAKPNERKKINATQLASVYTDAINAKCSSLVIDLQLSSPPVSGAIPEKSNVENNGKLVSLGSTPQFFVSRGLAGNITNNSSLVSTASAGTVTVNKTGQKNRVEKAAEEPLRTKLPTWIPDLNGTCSESYSTRNELESVSILSSELTLEQCIPASRGLSKTVNYNRAEDKSANVLSPGLTLEQPKGLYACSGLTKTVNHNRVEDNGESPRTCLLLRFAPGVYPPSKEDLMTTFCRFGPLKASETQLLKDNGNGSAQIVFVRSADAREAFRSLELSKLFELVDYKLHHLSEVSPPVDRLVIPTQPTMSMPMPGEAEQSKPFGVVDYKLHQLSKVSPPVGRLVIPTQPTVCMPLPGNAEQSKTLGIVDYKLQQLSEGRPPVGQPVIPTQPSAPMLMPGDTHPPLQFMKQNLQKMTSILENSGNNLSPQMRAKLDAEIKSLLKKMDSKSNV